MNWILFYLVTHYQKYLGNLLFLRDISCHIINPRILFACHLMILSILILFDILKDYWIGVHQGVFPGWDVREVIWSEGIHQEGIFLVPKTSYCNTFLLWCNNPLKYIFCAWSPINQMRSVLMAFFESKTSTNIKE